MLNSLYDYLIGKTTSILASYSESFPSDSPTLAVAYRVTGGDTNKALSSTRQYTMYSVNAIVRGNQDSNEICSKCDELVLALDLDQDGVIQTLVTTEPQYAYTDENGNLNYTFNLDVLM